jgi:hypothetical protein
MMPATILPVVFFYFFAGVCVACAFMVIAARNPVHSVLYLILAFFNAAGLFLTTTFHVKNRGFSVLRISGGRFTRLAKYQRENLDERREKCE